MKRYLIPIVVVLVVAWAAFGQGEGKQGKRSGEGRAKPTDEQRTTMRERFAKVRKEQLKAVETIEAQIAKLKAAFEADTGAAGRGGWRDLSAEEKTKLREKWTKRRQERQEAIEAIEAQLAKLKDPRGLRAKHEESIGELKAILELAVKEKAEETAKRLGKLIAKQQKEFEDSLQGLEQRGQRFQRRRGEKSGGK